MKYFNYRDYNIISDDNIFVTLKDYLIEKINNHLIGFPFFSLALSGGKTPVKLYRSLLCENLNWKRIKLFLVDERIVPPDSPHLNSKMIENELNTGEKSFFHPGENLYIDPYEAAFNMEFILKKELPLSSDGIPVIDLILLGVGSDGHTASIFYGNKAFYETEKIVALTDGPPPFEKRITFTFPLIENAKERWFLVAGEDKKTIVSDIFNGKDKNLPAFRASSFSPSFWFLEKNSLPDLILC